MQLAQKYLRESLCFCTFVPVLSVTDAKIIARVMIIDSFIIEGISNIGHLRLDVGEMNALIAPNGYGKSNVLDMRTIHNKRQDVLAPLEETLGVVL